MINKQWTRAGVGICTATALVVGAGLAFAPAANAVTPSPMVSAGLLDTTLTTVGGIVNGVLTPSPTATAPITVTTTGGDLAVGVGSTTVTAGTGTSTGTGSGSVGVGVTGTGSTAIGVRLGTSTSGTTITGSTSTSTGVDTTTDTNTNTGTSTSTDSSSSSSTGSGSSSTGSTSSTGSDSGTPIMLTALSATSAFQTVYPSSDGYRDSVAFQLKGTVSDGQQHAASGVATLTFGSTTVTSWPITATDNTITWNGRNNGKVVPGRYVFTAVIGDGTGAAVTGTESVDVSAKKLKATTTVYTTKSVTGKHKMAAKPLAGLAKDKVTLKVVSKISGIKGKQYLVFKHGTKKLKVLIKNGTHTSKAVTIPKSFTTYTTSHTWKKGVTIKSLKYKYTYKALK